MTLQIGFVYQEGVPESCLTDSEQVLRNILKLGGLRPKYELVHLHNFQDLTNPWIRAAVLQAKREQRYEHILQNRQRYYQAKGTLITDAMNRYMTEHPNLHLIMIMNDSIYARELNYCLGYSSYASTILSLGHGSPYACLGQHEFLTVLAHELGHKFGATDVRYRPSGSLVESVSFGTHCAVPGCLMNVVGSKEDIVRLTARGAYFCPICSNAIHRELSR